MFDSKERSIHVGGAHGNKAITTYPFGPRVYGVYVKPENLKWKVDIVVEDDVWIGYDVLVLAGVTIGRGSIVGARSVVTKDIPPYSIYAGTRIIRKRFSDNIIEKLMNLDYEKINHAKGDQFSDFYDMDLTEDNVEEIISLFQG